MLYRIIVVQLPHNRFSVDKIAFTKMKDRNTVMYHVNEHLGPMFNSFMEAAQHAQEILDLLAKIESNDVELQRANKDGDTTAYQVRKERHNAFIQYLNQLTRTNR